MEYRGSSVYDQSDFFSSYMKRRNRLDSPNNTLEGPMIFELLGNITGKQILDLGCGDAMFGKELLFLGANSYTGIEGSKQMVKTAVHNLEGTTGIIHHSQIESFQYPANYYEIVTSRFALHYVYDLKKLFQSIFETLKDHGHFVFSVQHPLTTSSFISKHTSTRRENWIVDDYFIEGERKEPWIDKIVVKYHRTIEQYFTLLKQSGFNIIDLREGTPRKEHFQSEEEFTRRQRIPIVLLFSCQKNKSKKSDCLI